MRFTPTSQPTLLDNELLNFEFKSGENDWTQAFTGTASIPVGQIRSFHFAAQTFTSMENHLISNYTGLN